MSIKLSVCTSPFTLHREDRIIPHGSTYREIIEASLPEVFQGNAHVLCGDQIVLPNAHDTKPVDGSHVIIRAVPTGGGEQATAKVSFWTAAAGFALMFIPGMQLVGWCLIGGGILGIGAAAGIHYMNEYLEDMMGGVKGSGFDSKQNPGISGGRNRLAPGGTIPLVLGKSTLTPYYGAKSYTQIGGTDGVDQYLYMLFLLGYGPLKVSNLKIGETLLASNSADVRNGAIAVDGYFAGVDIEIRQDESEVSLYNKIVNEEQLNLEIKYADRLTSNNIRTTAKNTTRIETDVIFARGLFSIGDDGSTNNKTVGLRMQYRPLTAPPGGAWTDVAFTGSTGYQITKAKQETIRYSAGVDITAGQYEVRVIRETEDDGSRNYSSFIWFALRSFTGISPVIRRDNVVLLGLKIKASGQLQGIVDQLNMTVESVVPTYSGSGSGVVQWATSAVSSNVADALLWVLRGPANPRPVPDSLVDWPAFEALHTWCDTKSMAINTVIFQAETMRDLTAKIAAVARASISLRDGRYSLVHDAEKTDVVQHFTPRNTWGFTGAKAFPEELHGYKILFVNADAGYIQDERVVLDDGYQYEGVDAFGNAGGTLPIATKFERVTLFGCTSAAQAWKQGRYMLARRRLRPEMFTVNVDVENIVCTRGDRVKVAHDVPLFGIASGQIKGIILDEGTGAATGITVDNECFMQAGKSYCVRIRYATGDAVLRTVTMVAGYQTTLGFTMPIPVGSVPEAGDLFMFGESSLESVDMMIAAVEMNDDLSAKLLLVEYNEAIYQADVGTIPAFETKITRPVEWDPRVAIEKGSTVPSATDAGAAQALADSASVVSSAPPTNNVTGLAFSSEDNADGSVNVNVGFKHTHGAIPADFFLIYFKSSTAAPTAIDVLKDPCILVNAESGTGEKEYSRVLAGLPSRSAGAGNVARHYRFGVVAGRTCRGGTILAGAVQEATGWTDKAFADTGIKATAGTFITFETGETRMGDDEHYIHFIPAGVIDPIDGTGPKIRFKSVDMELDDSHMATSVTIEGVKCSASHEAGGVVWRQETTPAVEKARIAFDEAGDVVASGIKMIMPTELLSKPLALSSADSYYACASSGGYLYAPRFYSANLDVISIESGSLTTKALPAASGNRTTCILADGKLHMTIALTNYMDVFNIATGANTRVTMPSTKNRYTGVEYSGKIYIPCDSLDELDVYDVAAGTVVTKSLSPNMSRVTCWVYDGKLYIPQNGGQDGQGILEVFDISSEVTTTQVLPTASLRNISVMHEGKVYMPSDGSDVLEVYDLATQTTAVKTLSGSYGRKDAFVYNGKLCMPVANSSDIEVYDIATEMTEHLTLPVSTEGRASALVGNCAYLLTGTYKSVEIIKFGVGNGMLGADDDDTLGGLAASNALVPTQKAVSDFIERETRFRRLFAYYNTAGAKSITVPDGVDEVFIFIAGAGGGGGLRGTYADGEAGGAAGGAAILQKKSVTPGETISFTLGTGGASEVSGTASTIDGISCAGGGRGYNGTPGTGGAVTGTSENWDILSSSSGGNGGNESTSAGGGGGAIWANNGNAASGATPGAAKSYNTPIDYDTVWRSVASTGGKGGAASGNGSPGSYGGGGGGCGSTTTVGATGGSGAAGFAIVCFNIARTGIRPYNLISRLAYDLVNNDVYMINPSATLS